MLGNTPTIPSGGTPSTTTAAFFSKRHATTGRRLSPSQIWGHPLSLNVDGVTAYPGRERQNPGRQSLSSRRKCVCDIYQNDADLSFLNDCSIHGGNVQLSDVPSHASFHHAHDRHKSIRCPAWREIPNSWRWITSRCTSVAQNPRSIGIVCWCPEIFLTVQGRRRFLSRSGVKDVGNV